jgi:hypothetical protein
MEGLGGISGAQTQDLQHYESVIVAYGGIGLNEGDICCEMEHGVLISAQVVVILLTQTKPFFRKIS